MTKHVGEVRRMKVARGVQGTWEQKEVVGHAKRGSVERIVHFAYSSSIAYDQSPSGYCKYFVTYSKRLKLTRFAEP